MLDFKLAYDLAKEKHKGQKYGEKDYFDFHILGVTDIVIEEVVNSGVLVSRDIQQKLLIVSLLHDTVEDSSLTVEEIEDLFGSEIAFAIEAITKVENESYNNYLRRVLDNPLALFVKLQDIKFNLSQVEKEILAGGKAVSKEDKLYRLKNKYIKANEYLRSETDSRLEYNLSPWNGDRKC